MNFGGPCLMIGDWVTFKYFFKIGKSGLKRDETWKRRNMASRLMSAIFRDRHHKGLIFASTAVEYCWCYHVDVVVSATPTSLNATPIDVTLSQASLATASVSPRFNTSTDQPSDQHIDRLIPLILITIPIVVTAIVAAMFMFTYVLSAGSVSITRRIPPAPGRGFRHRYGRGGPVYGSKANRGRKTLPLAFNPRNSFRTVNLQVWRTVRAV